MKPREILLHNEERFLPAQILTAGTLSAMYEAGRLRYIKCKGREVIRMIYPAVRDEHWTTIPYSIHDEHIIEKEKSFLVSYRASFHSSDINYEAHFLITGVDGELFFEMKGTALSDFSSKRIGLCVLHPVLPCAGMPIDIIQPGGKTVTSTFPVLINATQPFTDITGMRWKTHHNIDAAIVFEGDLFETEDQRNWSDDSYKTYSGPQYLVPMLNLKKGDGMHHKVTLKAQMLASAAELLLPQELEKKRDIPFPKIGYKREDDQQELSLQEVELFSKIPFDHYLVELKMSDKDWTKKLHVAAGEASALNTKLRLNIVFNSFSAAEKDQLLTAITGIRQQVEAVLVLSEKAATPPQEAYSDVYQLIKERLPQVGVGYGSNSWFANINSTLPVGLSYDFISFIVSPQAHQTDLRSIIENLRSQHMIIKTLQVRLGPVPVHIFLQFNKIADPRLQTNFAAWWTINTIFNLGEAPYLTLYHLKGDRGVINKEEQSPLYHLLNTIHEFRPVNIYDKSKEGAEDPIEAFRSARICLENERRERICFTVADI